MSLLCAQSSYSNYSGNTFFKERERWRETRDRLRNWGVGGQFLEEEDRERLIIENPVIKS